MLFQLVHLYVVDDRERNWQTQERHSDNDSRICYACHRAIQFAGLPAAWFSIKTTMHLVECFWWTLLLCSAPGRSIHSIRKQNVCVCLCARTILITTHPDIFPVSTNRRIGLNVLYVVGTYHMHMILVVVECIFHQYFVVVLTSIDFVNYGSGHMMRSMVRCFRVPSCTLRYAMDMMNVHAGSRKYQPHSVSYSFALQFICSPVNNAHCIWSKSNQSDVKFLHSKLNCPAICSTYYWQDIRTSEYSANVANRTGALKYHHLPSEVSSFPLSWKMWTSYDLCCTHFCVWLYMNVCTCVRICIFGFGRAAY